MSYLDGNELIYNDLKEGIYSGGFSVQSIMMREGLSPIMTLNTNPLTGGGSGGEPEKVSDLFSNLVIPNWAFSYNTNGGGQVIQEKKRKQNNESDDDSEEDDIIDDELHEKLLDLVKEHDAKVKQRKEKRTKKNMVKVMKGNTRRRKTKA